MIAAGSRNAEYARRVEAGHAEPPDRPIGGHERASVAVRQERIIGDWWERRGCSCTPVLTHRGCLSGRRSLFGGAHAVTQGPRERTSPRRTGLWSCHGQAPAHQEEMTRRQVSSMLYCETAKRRSGRRGVSLGRCSASALASRVWSDWQAISFSPRSIDHSIASLAQGVCLRDLLQRRAPPGVVPRSLGNNGDLSTSTTSSRPFWTKEACSGEPSSVASNCTSACRSRKVVITSQRTRWPSRKESRSTRDRFRREPPGPWC